MVKDQNFQERLKDIRSSLGKTIGLIGRTFITLSLVPLVFLTIIWGFAFVDPYAATELPLASLVSALGFAAFLWLLPILIVGLLLCFCAQVLHLLERISYSCATTAEIMETQRERDNTTELPAEAEIPYL